MKPAIVDKWDVKDRGDGIEIRVQFTDGSRRLINVRDDDADVLAETIQTIIEDEDRPVREGTHVR